MQSQDFLLNTGFAICLLNLHRNFIVMQLKLLSRTILNGIPSASGIEIYKNKIYIIGDDAGWLFILDKCYKLLEKIPLLKKKKLSNKPIPKKHKPDLEAMTFVKYKGENILLIFGSGSKPTKREKLFMVYPERKHAVEQYSLEELYVDLVGKKIKTATLNIEAAAANTSSIYLMHRGNVSKKNIIFEYSLKEFMNFILKEKKKAPLSAFRVCRLPQINAIPAGFSGASMLDEKRILFSASVEDSENEIDDGEILGSYIGIHNTETKELNCAALKKGPKPMELKIESVCLLQSQDNKHTVLAVTDSDGGDSELLVLELSE
jgi:hypothetical protein